MDSDFVLAKAVSETEANPNTTGQVVRVRVAAANDAGESLPGEPVEKTAPFGLVGIDAVR